MCAVYWELCSALRGISALGAPSVHGKMFKALEGYHDFRLGLSLIH